MLTTDTHAHLIGEVRLADLRARDPVGTGIFEVVTGPVATNTYAKEIDALPRLAGIGGARRALLQAAAAARARHALRATDVYGYAQVTVTAGAHGHPRRCARAHVCWTPPAGPCAPLVLTAR